jgi:uncharacterized membrane protein
MATTDQLEQKLRRWVEASVIDGEAADRIRTFELSAEPTGTRWPVVIAIAFGSIMVAAGVLLFVAAHWEELSPTQRFLLVLTMVGGFHLCAGALMPRMRVLGLALHGIGTVALGGGIFLAGQIFNLQEHWPGGILLWAIGAALGWAVLRDWIQASLAMLLIPSWIASEWSVRAEHYIGMEKYLVQFLMLLAITYLGARRSTHDTELRRALTWIGGLAVLPVGAILAESRHQWAWHRLMPMPLPLRVVGVLLVYLLPVALAWFLRGKAAVWNVGFAVWVFVMGLLNVEEISQNLGLFALYALASVALVLWGLQEQRRERINLGVAGFALTVIAFYFSTVMDKLGRSASLVAFGLLFLLGGWKLEQLRRKLVARTAGGTQ